MHKKSCKKYNFYLLVNFYLSLFTDGEDGFQPVCGFLRSLGSHLKSPGDSMSSLFYLPGFQFSICARMQSYKVWLFWNLRQATCTPLRVWKPLVVWSLPINLCCAQGKWYFFLDAGPLGISPGIPVHGPWRCSETPPFLLPAFTWRHRTQNLISLCEWSIIYLTIHSLLDI